LCLCVITTASYNDSDIMLADEARSEEDEEEDDEDDEEEEEEQEEDSDDELEQLVDPDDILISDPRENNELAGRHFLMTLMG